MVDTMKSVKIKELIRKCCFEYVPVVGCISGLAFSANITCNEVFRR